MKPFMGPLVPVLLIAFGAGSVQRSFSFTSTVETAAQSTNGSSAEANGDEVAPGVHLATDSLAWVVVNNSSQPPLALSHLDASIRSKTGANIARSAVWQKQRKEVVVDGPKAQARVASGQLSVFIQFSKAEENELRKSSPAGNFGYAIVKLTPEEKNRVVAWYEFSRFAGTPKLNETVLETKQDPVADSRWLRLTPARPLAPGEYALVQSIPGKNSYSEWVFDFGIDP